MAKFVAAASSIVVASVIVLSALSIAAPTVFGAPVSPSSRPMIRAGSASSYNWAGYAVTGPTGSVTDAKGSWAVPTLSCTSADTYVAFWVGIDGYSDSTVEQTGILGQCSSGAASYSAWYEFYPQPSRTIRGFPVSAGDVVSAEVSTSGSGSFTVAITDLTTGKTFSTTVSDSSAQLTSAEWITEAPSSGGSILPLANFGTVGFGQDNTGVSSTDYATVTGATGTIASFGSSVQEITMVSSSTNPSGAQPSALSPDGTSFTVSYVGSSSTTTSTTTTSSSTTTSITTTTGSTQSLSVSVTTNQPSYTQNTWAYITVTVTSSGTSVAGASVTVSVTAPNGAISSGTGTTNSNGQALFKYRISPNAPLGTYTVGASASASGYVSGSGSTSFTVT